MKEGSDKRKADEMDKDCSSPVDRRDGKQTDTFILNA
jgi:hypothetical protein